MELVGDSRERKLRIRLKRFAYQLPPTSDAKSMTIITIPLSGEALVRVSQIKLCWDLCPCSPEDDEAEVDGDIRSIATNTDVICPPQATLHLEYQMSSLAMTVSDNSLQSPDPPFSYSSDALSSSHFNDKPHFEMTPPSPSFTTSSPPLSSSSASLSSSSSSSPPSFSLPSSSSSSTSSSSTSPLPLSPTEALPTPPPVKLETKPPSAKKRKENPDTLHAMQKRMLGDWSFCQEHFGTDKSYRRRKMAAILAAMPEFSRGKPFEETLNSLSSSLNRFMNMGKFSQIKHWERLEVAKGVSVHIEYQLKPQQDDSPMEQG